MPSPDAGGTAVHFDDRRGRCDGTRCMLMPRGAARWRPKHALMQTLTRSQSRLAKPDLVMSFHWADARLVNEFPYLRLVGRSSSWIMRPSRAFYGAAFWTWRQLPSCIDSDQTRPAKSVRLVACDKIGFPLARVEGQGHSHFWNGMSEWWLTCRQLLIGALQDSIAWHAIIMHVLG